MNSIRRIQWDGPGLASIGPLTVYLRTIINLKENETVEVFPEGILIGPEDANNYGEYRERVMPAWAYHFVIACDRLFKPGQQEITRAQAIDILANG